MEAPTVRMSSYGFCVNQDDVALPSLHLSGYLTPNAGRAEGGAHTVHRNGALWIRQIHLIKLDLETQTFC